MIQVDIIRGSYLESSHFVHAVVVDEKGQVVKEFGQRSLSTSPRSAIKMLQALPLVLSGAADHFKLSSQHICLACSSHNSEKEHMELVDRWMTAVGVEETWFHCGPHWPMSEKTARQWQKEGKTPSGKSNNCSGKHLGFMSTALFYKEDPKSYYQYDHPRQKELRHIMTEVSGYDHHQAAWGIDGCGIPTYAMPLYNMAVGMSYLIKPNHKSEELQKACARILNSIKENPLYLAGSGDFVTTTIQKTQGRCLIKVGAEGVYCGVMPEKGYAFALKTVDGSFRGADAATTWLLRELGEPALSSKIPIKNWRGDEVGEIKVHQKLS